MGTNFYAGFLGPGATSQPADLLRHLRHMIHVAGLETVALGSDFDGIDTPLAWGDAGGMDQVVQALDQGSFSPGRLTADLLGERLEVLPADPVKAPVPDGFPTLGQPRVSPSRAHCAHFQRRTHP